MGKGQCVQGRWDCVSGVLSGEGLIETERGGETLCKREVGLCVQENIENGREKLFDRNGTACVCWPWN